MQILTPHNPPLNKGCLRSGILRKTLAFSRTPLLSATSKNWGFDYSGGNRWTGKDERRVVSAIEEENLGTDVRRKRKVVEHICLVKAKEDLSEEQEKDMLDFLYTTQYQMHGIVAISLGNISDENPEQYTHAIFMRFQAKEHLEKFYESPSYMGVLKEHVMPYCHVCSDMN